MTKKIITSAACIFVLILMGCSQPTAPVDPPALAEIMAGFEGDYYYVPGPATYGSNIERWDITTTSDSFSAARYGAQYQKTYDWNYTDTLHYTVSGYTYDAGTGVATLGIQGSDTVIEIYEDRFILVFVNGSEKEYTGELDPALGYIFAYDVNEHFEDVWYFKNIVMTTEFYAFNVTRTADDEFDVADRYYDGSWSTIPATTSQHISITNVNANIDASLYYGVFTADGAETDYITIKFHDFGHISMTFYTDNSYTTVRKLGGLVPVIYEMYTDNTAIGVPAVLFF